MFEVVPAGNRYTWQLICALGRVLVYTPETFESDIAAAEAAKDYRRTFWGVADQVDHRMARCI
jgi:hypothetical protein